jgi:1-phosphatidylinositol phosphodiesterase
MGWWDHIADAGRKTFDAAAKASGGAASFVGEAIVHPALDATVNPVIDRLKPLPPRENWNSEGWMSVLDSKRMLSELSIPGSHGTMTGHMSWRNRLNPLTPAFRARTVDQPLREQLDRGIRCLDIGCRRVDNRFAIHRGPVSCDASFEDVLAGCIAFLDAHPREAIVMIMKEEQDAADSDQPMDAILDTYLAETRNGRTTRDYFTPYGRIPTLGDARGRIVLLRRFASTGTAGVHVDPWPNNQRFVAQGAGTIFDIEDSHDVDAAAKQARVTEQLARAKASRSRTKWFITFASGGIARAGATTGRPGAMSDRINPVLTDLLDAHPKAFVGTLLLDFPFDEPGLVRKIAAANG